MLAANKQNLLLVQAQLKSITQGLRLLRQKRTGLVLLLLRLSKEGKVKQNSLSNQWFSFLQRFKEDFALVNSLELIPELQPKLAMDFDLQSKRVSGVYLNELKLKVETRVRENLKPSINRSFHFFNQLFPLFVEIAQLKHNCQTVANEVIKTNRKISNLENMIDNLSQEAKRIKDALQEKTNAEKAILIKLFG